MSTVPRSSADQTETRVGVHAFRSQLTRHLRQASQGHSVLITSHDEVIAEIHPPSPRVRKAREPGALRGQIIMGDDFDAWPDGMLDAMEA